MAVETILNGRMSSASTARGFTSEHIALVGAHAALPTNSQQRIASAYTLFGG